MPPNDITSEDIQEKFVYLADNFDSSKLKVAQLRDILLTHEVKYTQNMKKQKLEELFQSEVYSKRKALRKKYWNVEASDENFETATPEKKEKRVSSKLTHEHELNVPKRSRNPTKEATIETENSASRGRSASVANSDNETGIEEEEIPLSPRARRAHKRRIASDTLKAAPELPPQKSAGSIKVASPRRKRVNRKVEVPSEVEFTVPKLEEIKTKAPKRKREEEPSFIQDNVFQKKQKVAPFLEEEMANEAISEEKPKEELGSPILPPQSQVEWIANEVQSSELHLPEVVTQSNFPDEQSEYPNINSSWINEISMQDNASSSVQKEPVIMEHPLSPVQDFISGISRDELNPLETVDISYIPDVEASVAQEVHELVDNLPKVKLPNLPKLSMPKLPRLINLRLPKVKFPNPFKLLTCIFVVFFQVVLKLLFYSMIFLFLFFCGFMLMWFYQAYSSAQFCGTGAYTKITYPDFLTFDTGSPTVSRYQLQLRELLDKVRPMCLPCPSNAFCYQDRVIECHNEFVLTPSTLSSLGVWPFPPSCQRDWELTRKLDVFSDKMREYLQERKAISLCVEDSASAIVTESELKEHILNKKWETMSEEEFEMLWHRSVKALPSKYSDVYVSVEIRNVEQVLTKQRICGDSDECNPEEVTQEVQEVQESTTVFYTTSEAKVTLSCRLKLTVVAWYQKNKRFVHTSLGLLLMSFVVAFYTRRCHLAKIKDQKLAKRIVDFIKEKEYVKVVDVREEFGLMDIRLKPRWERIQRIVDQQSDIRWRQVEVRGDIHKVWESA